MYIGSSFGTDDYFMETDDEVENGDYVPQDNAKQLNEVGREAERKDSIKSKHGFLKVPLTVRYCLVGCDYAYRL